jgi:hypothetical protein
MNFTSKLVEIVFPLVSNQFSGSGCHQNCRESRSGLVTNLTVD